MKFIVVVQFWLVVLITLAILNLSDHGVLAAEPAIDFAKQIRPLLSSRCFTCHGPDEKAREGEFRLDLRADAIKEVISPGKSNKSTLIERISSKDPDVIMPPPDSKKKPLTKKQIELVRRWIDEGAKYSVHWAFVPPKRPSPPKVKNTDKTLKPIDAFVLARLQREGLSSSPKADRRTLIRRVALDLTGLPPTIAQVEAFVNDKSADAYEKVVDRLLASHRYGEHMSRYWLDAARYADTNGYQYDLEREQWVWRDWVINAFNTNKRFDRFTIEQLAGDLMPNATAQTRLATGFNRNHPITIEGGIIEEEYRTEYAMDRVVTTSTVWLGLTMLCSRCHDHKYDPIPQDDFYSFYAYFNQVPEKGHSGFNPREKIASPLLTKRLAAIDVDIAQETKRVAKLIKRDQWSSVKAESKLAKHSAIPKNIKAIQRIPNAKRNSQQVKQLDEYLREQFGLPELAIATTNLRLLGVERRTTAAQPSTMVMKDMPKRRLTYVLERGEYDKPIKKRLRNPLALPILAKMPKGAPANRLGLAQWLVSPKHPLTSRVTVNRFWQQLFGIGLVKTTEDFGSQGDFPSHPALLDWLAVEFIESGWNVKGLLKTMVMSATYRQSSHVTDKMFAKDPENRLLARGPRMRLDAEVIRDSALAVSGLLKERVGGPSVYPYHPKGLWLELNNRPGFLRIYKQDRGYNLYRRSMYTFWKRALPAPSMSAFDAPQREYCVVRRSRTNTPLQAFVLLHDPQFIEAARHLAKRMMTKGGDTVETRLAYGFKLATSRPPSKQELQLLLRRYRTGIKIYKADPKAAKKLLSIGYSARDSKLNQTEHAAYTNVARIILNLSEFITKG